MLDLDTGISVALALLAAFMGLLGVYMTLYPPESRQDKRLHVLAFLALAVFSVGLIIWQGIRNNQSQADLREDIRAARSDAKSAKGEATAARTETGDLRRELARESGRREQAEKDLSAAVQTTRQVLSGQMAKTESALSTNINQYRADTTNAVGRILRPPRTLGDRRMALIGELRKAIAGPHEVAITLARGNQECLDLYNEIESAFKEAGWSIGRSQFPFITKDGIGLQIQIKSMEGDLRPDQKAVALAFKSIGMQLIGGVQPDMKDGGPVEIYVGLQ